MGFLESESGTFPEHGVILNCENSSTELWLHNTCVMFTIRCKSDLRLHALIKHFIVYGCQIQQTNNCFIQIMFSMYGYCLISVQEQD